MNYDLKKIGKRIQECRKAYRDDVYCPDSAPDMETFGCILKDNPDGGFDRKTVSKWENGVSLPDLDIMLRMCDLFECELGYLLGEYETKTRTATDIQEETGLSEAAIDVLRNTDNNKFTLPLIDRFILESDSIARQVSVLDHDAWQREIQKALPTVFDKEKEIFDEVYGSGLPDYEKPAVFIEQVIEKVYHGYAGEGLYTDPDELAFYQRIFKNHIYQNYQRYIDDKDQSRAAAYRYNMRRTFDRIIDGLLDVDRVKVIGNPEDLAVLEERNDDNGEHEKK